MNTTKNEIAYERFKTYSGYYEATVSNSEDMNKAFVRTLALPS